MERKHKILFGSLAAVLLVALCLCAYFSYNQLMDYLATLSPTNESSASSSSLSSSSSSTPSNEESGESENSSTPAVEPLACSHNETEIRNNVDSTCTTNGYSGDTYCKSCNTLLTKGHNISASGHKSIVTTGQKGAGCTEAGYTGDKMCKDCGTSLEAGTAISPLGHRNFETVNVRGANCTDSGYTGDKKCTDCGEIAEHGSVIAALGHRNLTTVNVRGAGCTEEGYTGDKQCTECGQLAERGSVIAALGHRNTTVVNASSTYTGDHVCGECNHVFERGIAYTPGTDSAGVDSALILGAPVLTADQMVSYVDRWINLSDLKINCSLYELATYYLEEGLKEGVRGDIAFCQAINETGWFRFGGDVSPTQNNFCGLGAIGGGAGGAVFESARIGVRAHIQHLKGYASGVLNGECVDPRWQDLISTGRLGQYPKWVDLNGRWAVPGTTYAQMFYAKYEECRAQAVVASYVAASKIKYPYTI